MSLPDLAEEAPQRPRDELAAIAALVAEHSTATDTDALAAVTDVNERGPESWGWPLVFGAVQTALAPHVDPILAKVPADAHEEALQRLVPSMLSAFAQMAKGLLR